MVTAQTHSEADRWLYPADMVKRVLLGMEAFRRMMGARLDAADAGEHTVVSRRGKPTAVLVPIEWYRQAAQKMRDPTEF